MIYVSTIFGSFGMGIFTILHTGTSVSFTGGDVKDAQGTSGRKRSDTAVSIHFRNKQPSQ